MTGGSIDVSNFLKLYADAIVSKPGVIASGVGAPDLSGVGSDGPGGTTSILDNISVAHTVNTSTMFQSTGGASPFNTLNGLALSPFYYTGWALAGTWGTSGTPDNTNGTTWQLNSSVNVVGSRQAIAIGAQAKGMHVWSMNPFTSVLNGGSGYGIEIDVDVVSGTAGATGLLIAMNGSGVNTSPALTVQADGSQPFANGMQYRSVSGQPVASTGTLFGDDSGVIAASAVGLAGTYTYGWAAPAAITTGAGMYVAQNSGSAATSQALRIVTNGGFSNAGNLIQIQSIQTGSTAANGLVFHTGGSGQPVDPSGSLILADGGTFTYGLNLSAGTFTGAGIYMGSNSIQFSTVGGKVGTAPTQKIGFWGATPTVQPTADASAAGYVAGTGMTVTDDGTSTGGAGSSAYSFGGIVNALKVAGLIAL